MVADRVGLPKVLARIEEFGRGYQGWAWKPSQLLLELVGRGATLESLTMGENNRPTLLRELFDLTGQIALVTGGSRGLGLSIAEAVAEFGAMPVLVARKADELQAAQRHLSDMGFPSDSIATDLSDAVAAEGLAQEVIRRHGRIDVLVNNAGATWGAPAEEHPIHAWNKVMDLNVTGLFLLTQAVARRSFIPAGNGVVLNIASVEGLKAHHRRRGGTIAYNTAKGAVVNMTRALAAEWGVYGIRVNALAPGFFRSRMTGGTLDLHHDEIIDYTPLGKLGGRDDLKGAALLLASRAGGHITGHILAVDGGASVI
jgi:NAD(P)-dependent dehydrogenase (short-subunit alcohol dehydrogenase family)